MVMKSVFFKFCYFAARENIEFLESRKKQYLKAAVQAKKRNDLEQAKMYLRTAKSFDPKIELAKNGKLVDISKVSREIVSSLMNLGEGINTTFYY